MTDMPPLVPRPDATAYARRPRASRQARGYDDVHLKLRELVLAQHPVCQRCQREYSRHLHHKDHNVWNRHPDNLEALCVRCHMKHHNP